MKFRISKIYLNDRALSSGATGARTHKRLRAHRSDYYREAIVKSAARTGEEIRFSSLFEFAELEAPPKQKKRRLKKAFKKISDLTVGVGVLILKIFFAIGKAVAGLLKRLAPLSRPRSISMLFGALCAAIVVSLVSAFALGSALLARYFLPYEEFVIPELIGQSFDNVEELYSDRADLSVTYDYSSEHAEGTVIGQYPSSGVVKKQYAASPLPSISLKVSLGTKTYQVEDLVGKSEREALITLRENEVITKMIREHSETVEAGRIISTVPSAPAQIREGDILTLHVSLGKKITTIPVPDLYNLTESGAISAITDRALSVGDISYEASALPAGRVISQSPAPFSELTEGEKVSFTVSAGDRFSSHLIPDLYGMTVEQASAKLREVGIVVGSIYSVSSGAPSGTVVAQSPIPSSPIVSSITSVDLYISS